MKKTILAAALVALVGLNTVAQGNSGDKYRRSSLYSIMIVNPDVKGSTGQDATEAQAIAKEIPALFKEMPIPDKYDDHNIELRTLTLKELPAADPSIDVEGVKVSENIFAKFGLEDELGIVNDKKVVPQLMTLFKKENTAGKLINKWFANQDNTGFTYDALLMERAMNARTEEEKEAYLAMSDADRGLQRTAIATDLLNKTFVMASVYTYHSADRLKDLFTTAIVSPVADNPLLAAGAKKLLDQLTKNLKGYVCCYKTYLFRVDFDTPDFENNWGDKTPADFLKSNYGNLVYLGCTSGMKPLINGTSKPAGEVLKTATQRNIDSSIASLQKKYDEFKTLSTLRVADDGKTLVAKIGKKEGLKGGEKFDVLEKVEDAKGNITYKSVGSVQVVKGKVWDNRAGAGDANLDTEDEKTEDAAVTYTEFKGDAKKFANKLIRQKK